MLVRTSATMAARIGSGKAGHERATSAKSGSSRSRTASRTPRRSALVSRTSTQVRSSSPRTRELRAGALRSSDPEPAASVGERDVGDAVALSDRPKWLRPDPLVEFAALVRDGLEGHVDPDRSPAVSASRGPPWRPRAGGRHLKLQRAARSDRGFGTLNPPRCERASRTRPVRICAASPRWHRTDG